MTLHTDSLIDIDALKGAKNIMKQKFPKIIEYYFEDTATYLASIGEGLQKHDASLIVPASHTIKSSSRQLGAHTLADAASKLELTAKQVLKGEGDFSLVQTAASDIHSIFDRTKLQIEVAIEEVLSK